MRAIEKPSYDASEVFAMCVGSIEDEDLRDKLGEIAVDAARAAADYDEKASSASLFTIPIHVGNNSTVVLGGVTKGELKSLYTQHMVGAGKPARRIYDNLRALSLGNKCPLCGIGEVKTLDHYLPKAKYPLYSVLPNNLIPACRDCNTGKLASSANSAGDQSIHPYYDPEYFFSDQWLVAEVVPTEPATVHFFVAPPESWDSVSRDRAIAHFKNYDLSTRFSVQIADQISALRYELAYLPDEESRRQHLFQRAESHKEVHRNSWQTALHQALANSLWYCQEGFNLG